MQSRRDPTGRLRIAAACAILGLFSSCGARTPLNVDNGELAVVGDAGGDVKGDSDGQAGTDAGGDVDGDTDSGPCGNGSVKVLASLTLDAPQPLSEPESTPVLAWTGSELLVAWTRWTNGSYEHELSAVKVAQGTLTVLSASGVDPGNTTNPFNSRTAWDGTTLARFWAQDDGSVVMQRFGADAAAVEARHTVIAPTGSQTIATDVLAVGGGYLLTWGVQQPDGFITYMAHLSLDGTFVAGPTVLYVGSGYDLGAKLASAGGQVFAGWTTHPQTDPSAPVTTTIATVDPSKAAVLTTTDIDTGVDHALSAFVAESNRLDVAIRDYDLENVSVLSSTLGAMAFKPRAVVAVTETPSLAPDSCGLVALLPTGHQVPDVGLPTALTVQRIGEQGVTGDALQLPVTGDAIESSSIIPVEGGFAAGWVEYQGSAMTTRALRIAYMTIP